MSLVCGLGNVLGGCFGKNKGPLICTNSSLVTSTDPFDDGSLIVKYLLDGDATDLCGNYDGTDNGVTYEEGKFGQGAAFEEGEFLSSDDILLNQDIFTTSMFVKFNNFDGNQTFLTGIDSDGDNTNDGTIWCDGDKIRIHSKWGYGDYDYSFNVSEWYHLGYIHDSDNNLSVIINGCIFSITHTDLDPNNLVKFGIGTDSNATFNGVIDQVEIYNRVLNPQEVQMLYTQSKYYCDPTQAISGLVAHYPLEGTAEDLTGNYNGTENGDLTYVETEVGIAGNFDGEDDYIALSPISTELSEYSITLWFQDNGEEDYSHMFVADDQADFAFKYSADKDAFYVYTESSLSIRTPEGSLLAYELAFLSIVIDSSTIRFYKNGVEIFNDDFSEKLKVTGYKIGSYSSEYGKQITNNVRIYDRALTQEEIETIYNYEKITRNIVIDRGLVAYYHLHNSSEDHWVGQYDGVDTDTEYDSNSASFNGTSSYINIDEVSNTLKDVKSCSIAFWFKTDAVDSDNDYSNQIFSCHDSDGNDKIRLAFNSNKTFLVLDSEDDSGTIDNTYNDGKWYFACITIDDNLLCTINNEKILEYDYSFDFSNITKVSLGQEYDGSSTSDFFDGNIANVRVYDRVLNQEEITTIYESEKVEFI